MLSKVKLAWSKTNRWHRVVAVFALVELKLLPAPQLGFWCNDPALSHPYTGDTISWKWLIGVSLLLPLAVMLIVERQRDKIDLAKKQALWWYREYLFGFLINLTLVQCIKFLVGSPRPHFFDTCRPKEALTCEASEYVSSYTCTKAHWLNQSDRSFPSGHTSLAFHSGIFIIYYLRRRAGLCSPRWLLSAQVLVLLVAGWCALSRVTDRRHHWWDVVAGAAIAVAFLAYTIFGLCKNFECSTRKSEVIHENQRNETSCSVNEELIQNS